jgi:hypothetical protein
VRTATDDAQAPQAHLSEHRKGGAMGTLFTIIVVAVVLAGLAVGVWALFEMSPHAKHDDRFRNPATGRRRGESPHLD